MARFLPSPSHHRRRSLEWLLMMSLLLVHTLSAFQFPKLFGGINQQNKNNKIPILSSAAKLQQQKQELLTAISNTNNGKTATPQQQIDVLRLVGQLEAENMPPPDFLTRALSSNNNNDPAKDLLQGVWYLQYTSPSQVVLDTNDSDDNSSLSSNDESLVWKPKFAKEGASNIETKQFNAKGTVSAAGITVDTSNRPTQQIIQLSGDDSTVTNTVQVNDWCKVLVSGKFRPSPNVPNRVIVSFDTAQITLQDTVTLDLGFAFAIAAVIRGSKDNGWLEITYCDDTLRLSRGNKGTMFVLTRDPNAVQP